MTNEERKQYAFILFTKEHLDGKICAKRAGVSEKTMSKWVNEDNGRWKTLRSRMLISRDKQLNDMYAQLEALNFKISTQDEAYPDTKQADVQIKLTAAIRNMETDLAIADIVHSGIRFIKFLQRIAPADETISIADYWNSFIQDSISR